MSAEEQPQSPPDAEQDGAEQPLRDLRVPAALVRTAFSSEQSLMSWIRTSLSMFTFGFSITKFFHYLEQQEEGIQFATGPRLLGISLICVGILVLLLAIAEHVLWVRRMKQQGLPSDAASFLPLGSAAALLVLGIAALLSTVWNWSL